MWQPQDAPEDRLSAVTLAIVLFRFYLFSKSKWWEMDHSTKAACLLELSGDIDIENAVMKAYKRSPYPPDVEKRLADIMEECYHKGVAPRCPVKATEEMFTEHSEWFAAIPFVVAGGPI